MLVPEHLAGYWDVFGCQHDGCFPSKFEEISPDFFPDGLNYDLEFFVHIILVWVIRQQSLGGR